MIRQASGSANSIRCKSARCQPNPERNAPSGGLNAVESKENRWRNALGELAMDELAVELLSEPSQLWR